ncbi:mitochondrial outer membrane protein SLC25A46 [Leptinotarsa decemlineata]|uniref:mitochondrial outer membrane protein SLC25A46 n=1 Tax=Leptinotarsa decemlineata TaxID=7539 RepID=UPI000C2557D2|nr:solute carrier family 25 member 46-like [Leptinotarsa decemlineata]
MDNPAYIFGRENQNVDYFNNPDLIRRLPVHDDNFRMPERFVPYTLDEDPKVKRFIGSGITFISLVAENLLSHPFVVLRRQCQVHHTSRRYHLQPFTLVPVVWRLYQHQGLTAMWKGVGSVLVVRGMTLGVEDLISKFTPLPKEISWHSSLKQFFQHIVLKCASLAIVTPFYSASFVETVQSEIASEKPGIVDVFKEGMMRLMHWGSPTNGRMLPVWALIVPTVALGLARYLLSMLVKGVTSRILVDRTQRKYERKGALLKDNSSDLQNIEVISSIFAAISSDIILYPCETVIHRIHLQGTRTIVDNLDSGRSVLPILTNYTGASDCYESCLLNEGVCGLYKGFGALILQYVAHIALIKISHFLLTEIGGWLGGNEIKPAVKVSPPAVSSVTSIRSSYLLP